MGILNSTAQFLLTAKTKGVDYSNTLTLGRQNMFASPREVQRLWRKTLHTNLTDRQVNEALHSVPFTADGFLKLLGAKEITSIDYSDYEGSTIQHDLNEPIDESLHCKFSVVMDIGTLEHVYNFPVALQSCMNLTQTGGHLLIATPTNNYCGHGFYQFSPELFYRTLSPENGFCIERLICVENDVFALKLGQRLFPVELLRRAYKIVDPDAIRRRILVTTKYPAQMFIQAKKIEQKKRFITPQQSDYTATWNAAGSKSRIADKQHGEGPATWALKKNIQLHWLPLTYRYVLPGFFRRKLLRRRLRNRPTDGIVNGQL